MHELTMSALQQEYDVILITLLQPARELVVNFYILAEMCYYM